MATLSSTGIGSGLQVDTMVTQLVALERKPISLLNDQTSTLQTKLSAFGLLQSYSVNVHDTVARLAKPALWSQTAASSSDASAVTVSASTSAAIGTYSVEVSQLAQAHSLASRSYADSATSAGTGTLHITLGSWNPARTAFTAAVPATTLDVPVTAGNDSLDAIKTAINAADAGVTASIVKDANGSRLVIRSNTTGAEHAVRITADADAPAVPGGNTLADLVYDPEHTTPARLTETAAALNAKGKLNGLDIESASNTFTDVSQGLSISVAKQTTSAVTLGVSLDKSTMKSAITDFVNAYNAISKYVTEQTKYDADKKVAATLQGDRSTLSLQSQLRSVVQAFSKASSRFGRLSDMGIETKADGTLGVNDTRLSAAMSHMEDVAAAFTNTDAVDRDAQGFAVRMEALTTAFTSTDGLVSTRSKGLRDSIARNTKQAAVMEDRVQAYQERLMKQYSALDLTMNKLTSLNAYVTQQVAAWNKD